MSNTKQEFTYQPIRFDDEGRCVPFDGAGSRPDGWVVYGPDGERVGQIGWVENPLSLFFTPTNPNGPTCPSVATAPDSDRVEAAVKVLVRRVARAWFDQRVTTVQVSREVFDLDKLSARSYDENLTYDFTYDGELWDGWIEMKGFDLLRGGLMFDVMVDADDVHKSNLNSVDAVRALAAYNGLIVEEGS